MNGPANNTIIGESTNAATVSFGCFATLSHKIILSLNQTRSFIPPWFQIMISVAFATSLRAATAPARSISNRQLSMACASSVDKLNSILEEYRQKKWVVVFSGQTTYGISSNKFVLCNSAIRKNFLGAFERILSRWHRPWPHVNSTPRQSMPSLPPVSNPSSITLVQVIKCLDPKSKRLSVKLVRVPLVERLIVRLLPTKCWIWLVAIGLSTIRSWISSFVACWVICRRLLPSWLMLVLW